MKKKSKVFAKKMLSLLLVVAMVITCLPVQAKAAANQTIEISVGETKTLKTSRLLSKTSWESSDDAVATVSKKGVVTGVSVGTATVTGTTKSMFIWFGSKPTVKTYQIIVTEGQEEAPDEPEVPEKPETDKNWLIKLWGKFLDNIWGNGGIEKPDKPECPDKPERPNKPDEPEVPEEPEIPEDPEVPEEPEVENYTVRFMNDNDTIVEEQKIEKGQCAIEPEAPQKEGYYFVGWHLDKNDKDYENSYDFNSAITSDMTLYAVWIGNVDTDEDGLLDDLESIYGTDKNKKDTDEDGLIDYLEIFLFITEPTLADTDSNGVNDGEEDFDYDELSNSREVELGTDPLSSDSDEDLLLDGEEVNTYETDPLDPDTDDDGALDGKEVELGTDPLSADKSFNISLEAKSEEDSVFPSVDIELSGEQIDTLSIDPVDDKMLFPETMPGYLGKAYEFKVDGSFSIATINFKFDSSKLSEDSEPTIYYFNEEEQELEELETTVSDDVASACVTHFSKYILIDRKIYQDTFTWQDTWENDKTYTSAEIVMVIDDSGSLGGDYGYDAESGYFLGGNDPQHKRLEVARAFVEDANSTFKIGVVKFDGRVDMLTPDLLVCNEEGKESLKDILKITPVTDNSLSYNAPDIFDSRGYTEMYTGIDAAFDLFSVNSGKEDSVLRAMIVFTDGIADDTHMHNSVVTEANNAGIRIYTVGLGNSTAYFTNYLEPLAVNTGASFYYTSDADKLMDIYQDIGEKIDIEKDSDMDGIPDYYEDNMILFNGVNIKLDKNNPDTDGDGIKDGEEVVLKYEYNENRSQVKVTGRLVLGNPLEVDTDDDGYGDNEDLNPLTKYKTPIILLHGLNDNTTCYGVSTLITKSMNTDYGHEYTKPDSKGNEYLYTDCTSHRIKSISNGKLGKYLKSELKYSENKNLFAFNYPNHDMVQYNGRRLKGYIDDLIKAAQNNEEKNVVDSKYLFATKEDSKQGNVNFILIGHSMGGLVSRYYIENIGTTHVEKLITIDTPHYGSGLADASDNTGDIFLFSPSIYDLETDSTLYGGKERTWGWAFILSEDGKKDSEYAINNQSPALKGNHNCSVDYYAIGGYDVGRGWIGGELDQLAKGLRNTVFGFDFARSVKSKDAYKNSINDSLDKYSKSVTGETSKLDLGDADGDNTVDYMSQFAVRFRKNDIDYQVLKKTAMIVNSKDNADVFNPFHNSIHGEKCMHEFVSDYIND